MLKDQLDCVELFSEAFIKIYITGVQTKMKLLKLAFRGKQTKSESRHFPCEISYKI